MKKTRAIRSSTSRLTTCANAPSVCWVYGSRIAVEFFHAVTDGTGGLIFLKTLVAEYLCQKYKINIPPKTAFWPLGGS